MMDDVSWFVYSFFLLWIYKWNCTKLKYNTGERANGNDTREQENLPPTKPPPQDSAPPH
jgi:hypothetical protein